MRGLTRFLLVTVAYMVAAVAMSAFLISMGATPLMTTAGVFIALFLAILCAELLTETAPDREPHPDPHGCRCGMYALPHRHTSHRSPSHFYRMRKALS